MPAITTMPAPTSPICSVLDRPDPADVALVVGAGVVAVGVELG